MEGLNWPRTPNLLVGIESRDDAGVYRITDDLALIQTLDFFTPMVDDPFVFGKIAAVNALNDIYAMGGRPLLAMNVVCYPQCQDLSVLRRILEGGLDKVVEAGALIVGGHTVDDNEPKYGLSVCGLVHPDRVMCNSGARPGDRLFLTKPLGNGIITTAIKAGMASAAAIEEAVTWMTTLNRVASETAQAVGALGATDITGFGLIGHLYEMAAASDVEVELYVERLLFMQGTLEYASMGLIPAGAYNNRDYLADKVEYIEEIDVSKRDLLFAPETSGGLLVALSGERADRFIGAMQELGELCCEIGRVTAKGFKSIKIKR